MPWHILMITPRRSSARSSRICEARSFVAIELVLGALRLAARAAREVRQLVHGVQPGAAVVTRYVRYRRVSCVHRLLRPAQAAASKPVRAGGVQLGASAIELLEQRRLGFAGFHRARHAVARVVALLARAVVDQCA